MNDISHTIGFITIVTIYASVGVFAAIGSAVLTQRFLKPKWEQVFYAAFLMAIAAFYLAFAAYFDATQAAWTMESRVVLLFCALALLGLRMPQVLMLGYGLHGAWDFLHELEAHSAASGMLAGASTEIPLAYGVFCASFDLTLVLYILRRRADWLGAWRTRPT